MVFEAFPYLGEVYDLSHLSPIYQEFVQAAKKAGETEKRYRCMIEFGGRCL